MNTLLPEYLNIIKETAEICNRLGFEEFVIDKESRRAVNKSAIMCTPNISDFNLNLGITRIQLFLNRMKTIESINPKTFEIMYENSDRGYVKKIIFKNKKTSIDFSCADPNNIKTYRTAKDPMYFEITVTEELHALLSSIRAIMAGEKNFHLTLEKGKAKVFSIDSTGDSASTDISDFIEKLPNCDKDSFAFSYSLDIILPLLTQNIGKKIQISKRGFWKMDGGGNTFYIVPGV
jgi:hypothetical protein